MQFKDIIGQSEIKDHLVNMVQSNRLSHALLFLGKEGNGDLALAIAFAQYLVCEKVNNKNSQTETTSLFGAPEPETIPNEILTDACGVCSACVKAAQLVHPDINFSYPIITKKAGEKPLCTDFIKEWREFISIHPYGNAYDWLQFINAENKQGNIPASECNDIIRKLNLKSFESGYKILIMWMPEFLGNEGNKLLKLIEEPPANTLFILVAQNQQQILPTILSRTQLVKVPALANTEVQETLEQKANVEINKAKQLAAQSEGNYREALQLLQHSENDWQSILREWLNTVVKRNLQGQVQWIDDMSKNGREKQKQFLQYFIHLLELAIRQQAISNLNPELLNSSDTDFAVRLNKLCSIYQQEAIINELNNAIYYIERNANPKMLFHALSIKLYHIISNNSLILVN